jgi:ABC-2 type transport system ATP-binding protein
MAAAISITDLTKTYATGQHALKGVSLEIRPGEIFALLGPNGAGKTTLISIVCGIVRPTSGTVLVEGHDIQREFRAARERIGLVPQELAIEAFETVRAAAAFSRGLFGRAPDPACIERVLRDLSLWDRRDDVLMTLSGGMKRRVMIAKAIAHEPQILFLDEPTAGVDVELRQGLWAFVRRLNAEGQTVVLTTHYLEEAEMLCDRIAMLKGGRIVALDTTANLIGRHHALYLRVRLDGPLPDDLAARALGTEGGMHTFRLDDSAGLEPMLAAFRQAGRRALEVEVAQPDLEEVFVQIMRSER